MCQCTSGLFNTGAPGVVLYDAGSVANTGKISGGAGGAAGYQPGVIAGLRGSGIVLAGGGQVTNGLVSGSSALITGDSGIIAVHAVATVSNYGTIAGISGAAITPGYAQAGIVLAAGGTVSDAGTISDTNGTAISFGGSGNNLLVLEHGYSLSGSVTVAGTANTLELLGTAGAVIVDFDKVAAGFTNFGTVAFGARRAVMTTF